MNAEDYLLKSYDYELPQEFIAQYPSANPEDCRLLVVPRDSLGSSPQTRCFVEDSFRNIGDHLPSGALLIVNNARVLPARLYGKKETGGNAEFLLLTPLPLLLAAATEAGPDLFQAQANCLLRQAGRLKPGARIIFSDDFDLEIVKKKEFGEHKVLLRWHGSLENIFEKLGQLPLPPYIRRPADAEDQKRYQTFFASKQGAVAAPTAGLHFTEKMKNSLMQKGFLWRELTLYVGYGTFSPVRCQDIRRHAMHEEYIEISQSLAQEVNQARKDGRPIVAIGTTSLRALESAAKNGMAKPCSCWTDIFLYPGAKFNITDCLVTNFHLPQSTLLMLVSAFAGRKKIMAAYEQAKLHGFRFFSYGDAMLIK